MLRRALPLILIAIAAVAVLASGGLRYVSVEALQEQREALDAFIAAQPLAAVAAYLALFVLLILLSLPVSFALSVVGGYLFGPVLATPLALTAVTGGSTLFFLATRGALGALLRARVGGRVRRIEDGFRGNAFNYLLAIRLMPVAPVYLTNLAVGLVGMNAGAFALATFLGLIPATIVFASVGHGLRAALDAGVDADPAAAAQRMLLSPEIILPILGLIVLALAPVAWRRFRRA